MTTFSCAACGQSLTDDLRRLPAVPARPDQSGRRIDDRYQPLPTLPLGSYAIDPEPSGAPLVPVEDPDWFGPAFPGGPSISDDDISTEYRLVSAGPRNTYTLNPADMPTLQWYGNDFGCCGMSGRRGPNRACQCGAPIGTLLSDCFYPFELHLQPGAVIAVEPAIA